MGLRQDCSPRTPRTPSVLIAESGPTVSSVCNATLARGRREHREVRSLTPRLAYALKASGTLLGCGGAQGRRKEGRRQPREHPAARDGTQALHGHCGAAYLQWELARELLSLSLGVCGTEDVARSTRGPARYGHPARIAEGVPRREMSPRRQQWLRARPWIREGAAL